MENKCAPGKKFTEGSCFTLENLKDIATNYNQAHADKISIENKTKRELLKELIPKFKKKFDCDDQICWLSTAPVKAANDDATSNGSSADDFTTYDAAAAAELQPESNPSFQQQYFRCSC